MGLNRHELFVSLAQPYTNDAVAAAEVYRVGIDIPLRRWHLFGIYIGCLVLALTTGAYLLASRFVIGAILMLIAGAFTVRAMVMRWRHGKANLVLIGLGSSEVVALRTRFTLRRWTVVDLVGRWQRGCVPAVCDHDLLSIRLQAAASEVLDLNPLALTPDAAQIAHAVTDPPDRTR